MNEGGFVNHSFRVADRNRCYHIKLATHDYYRTGLLRWQQVSSLLERYRAPAVLQWVDVGGASGLVFHCLPGTPPTLNAEVLREVSGVMRGLNRDAELVDALRRDARRTARDVYYGTYHERFQEDLKSIAVTPPYFITPALLQWLYDEADRLAQLVDYCGAFNEPADKPVHGDLWLNNILWQNSEHWHVVDWDGIALGDPMQDLAMLTGPSASDVAPLKLFDQVASGLTREESERLVMLGRAALLDWIIDPVADWLDADVAPAHAQATRLHKERVHRAALATYRSLYPA